MTAFWSRSVALSFADAKSLDLLIFCNTFESCSAFSVSISSPMSKWTVCKSANHNDENDSMSEERFCICKWCRKVLKANDIHRSSSLVTSFTLDSRSSRWTRSRILFAAKFIQYLFSIMKISSRGILTFQRDKSFETIGRLKIIIKNLLLFRESQL